MEDVGAPATTALLVEDHPSVRALLTRFLARAGIVVISEDRGRRALELGRRFGRALDLVIVDVQLGGHDGISLALEFRQLCPGIPVLLMTSFRNPRLEVLERAGMRSLAKPFSQRRLLDAIRELLWPQKGD